MSNNKNKKEILPLFVKFIQESKTGRRIQKNGKKISKSTLSCYNSTLRYLIALNNKTQISLFVSIVN